MFNKPLILSGTGVRPLHKINQSIRFDSSANAHMDRTPSSAGNQKTWTWSAWVKRGKLGSRQYLFTAFTGSNTEVGMNILRFQADDTLNWAGYTKNFRRTNQVFRDTSAWYHIVLSVDTTDPVGSEKQRIYVNGERVTSFADSDDMADDTAYSVNNTVAHAIGIGLGNQSSYDFDGYMAEIVLLDGTATTCNSFGEFNSSGIWIPKDVSGLTFGTNGFHIKGQFAGPTNPITALGNIQHSTAQAKIGSSSILFDGNGDLLEVGGSSNWYNFGADGNPWTMEAFIRFDTVSITQRIFWQNNTFIGIEYITGSGIKVRLNNSGGADFTVSWSPSINTWYHLAVVRETNNTTTVYIDGTSIGSGTISGGSSAEYKVEIGAFSPSTNEFDGYMDEIRISSVARFTSSFTPTTTEYTADGDTLALIHSNTTNGSTVFKNDVGFGNDSSGNQNNFATTALLVHDQVSDSPTNNFCVMNPLDTAHSPTISNGNLSQTKGSASYASSRGTIAFDSTDTEGIYFEVLSLDATGSYIGVLPPEPSQYGANNATSSSDAYIIGTRGSGGGNTWWTDDGGNINSGNNTSVPKNAKDVIGVAVKNGKVYFSINGNYVLSADPATESNPNFSGLTGLYQPYFNSYNNEDLILNAGQDGTFAGNKTAGGNSDANGIGNFFSSVPTGFKALCTKNLGS